MTGPTEVGLFDVVKTPSPPDLPTRVQFTLSPSDSLGARGPGPERSTGPHDAQAPHYWVAEAERLVLTLTASGHEVTSDDVHARYPDEPSATGAAIGALFRRLSRRGQLVLVAHRPSQRPEARSRVVGVWRAP